MAQLLINDFNVGTDLQQVILVPDSGPNINANAIGHLEELSATQNVTPVTITPVLYNGIRLHRNIYHDWSGRLNFSRFNGDITSLMQGIMSRFHETGQETFFTIYAQVRNTAAQAGGQPNAMDEYAFLRCVIAGHEIGMFNGTTDVKAPLTFLCQDLILPGGGQDVLTDGPTAT